MRQDRAPVDVQRFVLRAKPHRDHPQFFEWQTATICVFIGESDRAKAQARAVAELRGRQWEPMEFVDRSTLIEKRVRSEGGEVLDAYLKAQAGEVFYLEETDEIPFATKETPLSINAPRLTEAFMDAVVTSAGGERIDVDDGTPNPPKTADYHVGGIIFELKDLQTEGMEVTTRQEKVGKLFASKLRPDGTVVVDVASLSPEEYQMYLRIVGEPIRKRLAEAGRQVRPTLERIAGGTPRGGAILLNSGYGSISPAALLDLASEYVRRSSTIQVVICISAWTVTNGMDTVVKFAFNATDTADSTVETLKHAFWREINQLMDEWAKRGLAPAGASAPALRPIVFDHADGTFTVPSPKAPNSIPRDP